MRGEAVDRRVVAATLAGGSRSSTAASRCSASPLPTGAATVMRVVAIAEVRDGCPDRRHRRRAHRRAALDATRPWYRLRAVDRARAQLGRPGRRRRRARSRRPAVQRRHADRVTRRRDPHGRRGGGGARRTPEGRGDRPRRRPGTRGRHDALARARAARALDRHRSSSASAPRRRPPDVSPELAARGIRTLEPDSDRRVAALRRSSDEHPTLSTLRLDARAAAHPLRRARRRRHRRAARGRWTRVGRPRRRRRQPRADPGGRREQRRDGHHDAARRHRAARARRTTARHRARPVPTPPGSRGRSRTTTRRPSCSRRATPTRCSPFPRDFSASVTSLSGETPTKANLDIRTDDAHGYLAGSVAQSVGDAMSTAFGRELTTQYLEGFYSNLATIGGALGDAADGATQLSSGVGSLANGLGTALRAASVRRHPGRRMPRTAPRRTPTASPSTPSGVDGIAGGVATLSQQAGGLDGITDGMSQYVAGCADRHRRERRHPAVRRRRRARHGARSPRASRATRGSRPSSAATARRRHSAAGGADPTGAGGTAGRRRVLRAGACLADGADALAGQPARSSSWLPAVTRSPPERCRVETRSGRRHLVRRPARASTDCRAASASSPAAPRSSRPARRPSATAPPASPRASTSSPADSARCSRAPPTRRAARRSSRPAPARSPTGSPPAPRRRRR